MREKKTIFYFGLVLILTACQAVNQNSVSNHLQTPAGAEQTIQVTSTTNFPVVLTHTPQSYPSALQAWLVGTWQQIDTTTHYHFANDFELILRGEPNLVLGSYRFVSENELVLPWNNEMIEVEIWQLDQNSLLINFPDGLSKKFIRVSP
jgi:hypothetical protein